MEKFNKWSQTRNANVLSKKQAPNEHENEDGQSLTIYKATLSMNFIVKSALSKRSKNRPSLKKLMNCYW